LVGESCVLRRVVVFGEELCLEKEKETGLRIGWEKGLL
jgi:hypothetical protein